MFADFYTLSGSQMAVQELGTSQLRILKQFSNEEKIQIKKRYESELY